MSQTVSNNDSPARRQQRKRKTRKRQDRANKLQRVIHTPKKGQ